LLLTSGIKIERFIYLIELSLNMRIFTIPPGTDYARLASLLRSGHVPEDARIEVSELEVDLGEPEDSVSISALVLEKSQKDPAHKVKEQNEPIQIDYTLSLSRDPVLTTLAASGAVKATIARLQRWDEPEIPYFTYLGKIGAVLPVERIGNIPLVGAYNPCLRKNAAYSEPPKPETRLGVNVYA
jgi:hypothetical protein